MNHIYWDTAEVKSTQAIALYRSRVQTAMYMSPDIPTIQFSAKELARHSSKPTEGALNGMRHLAGYLMNNGRIIHHFPWYVGIVRMT